MRRSLPLLFALLLPSLALAQRSAPPPLPLDPLLTRADLWAITPTDFATAAEPQRFVWTSATKDSARSAYPGLTFLGLPVFEAVTRYKGDKPSEWTLTLFARGDAGELPREQFSILLQAALERISAHAKVKYEARGKDANSAVKADGFVWQTPTARYTLEYSFTREVKSRGIPFRAEFIRLQIAPPERTVGLLASAAGSPARNRFTGALHVKRDLNSGDVLIHDLPMVDQGDKGYCAVACTERVMRYYGIPVDANELAQIANSDAEAGTNADVMFAALKRLGARLRVRVRPIEEMDVRGLLDLIADYNRAARKGNRAQPLPDPGYMLNLPLLIQAMKPELLKEVRNKNRSDVSRFQRTVQMQVDSGMPLIWAVMLGIVPEPEIPQAGGGHMRLIIGYNLKTQEILYSDSWGAGHELKRMPLADAWTITLGLTSVEPM